MEWVDSCWKGKQGGGLATLWHKKKEGFVFQALCMYGKKAIVSVNDSPWLEQISIDIINYLTTGMLMYGAVYPCLVSLTAG